MVMVMVLYGIEWMFELESYGIGGRREPFELSQSRGRRIIEFCVYAYRLLCRASVLSSNGKEEVAFSRICLSQEIYLCFYQS
jgi:hypothetical protein